MKWLIFWHNQIERPFANWHGAHYFTAAVGLLVVAVAILYYAILTRPAPIPPPPLHITNFRLDRGYPILPGEQMETVPEVCSGYTYAVSWQIAVDRPVVVSIQRTILDQYGHTRPGTEEIPLYRVYPWPRIVVERTRFQVPTLPPGGYTKVFAFVALDRPSQPEIFTIPFVVREFCMGRPEDETVSPNDPGRPGVALTATSMSMTETPPTPSPEKLNR